MVAFNDDQAQIAFNVWVDRALEPRMLERNIRPRTLSKVRPSLRFLPEVIERQSKQKEFHLPIWEYLEIATSHERVSNGRRALRKNRSLFNQIEAAFGVEPEVIAAIWGLETGYGMIRGDFPTLSALASLAYKGRRAGYFEEELAAALRIIQSTNCAPDELYGSWAGALGHGQFMPSAVLEFGVDFNGDRAANVCESDPSDALASIANYLKKHAWKKGRPWGVEVGLPDGFDFGFAGIDQTLSCAEWAALGLTTPDGAPLPDYGAGSLLLPAGGRGVALLVTQNFHVITSYNKSEAYAIGIGHLADRIGGGKPFFGKWPVEDRGVTVEDVREVQFLLSQLGFDTKGIDGMRGPNTMRAARAFQQARGLVPDGYLSAALLEALRGAIRERG